MKKSNIKKWISFGMAGIMTAGALMGCSSSGSGTAKVSATTQESKLNIPLHRKPTILIRCLRLLPAGPVNRIYSCQVLISFGIIQRQVMYTT